MEVCTHCGCSFRTFGVRKTHEKYCIGNKIPRLDNDPIAMGSFSRNRINREPSEIPNLVEDVGPSQSYPSQVPFVLDANEVNIFTCNDYVEEDVFYYPNIESSKNIFDSTFVLWQWIRTVQRTIGLSNNDIDRLFKILLHPSFRIESLTIKSAVDVLKYEQSFYCEDEGWHVEDVLGYNLHYRDPIDALELLYSSPSNAENFMLAPSMQPVGVEKVYSTPATGTWWHSMQVYNPSF
jgi:hypothetical protein